MALYKVVFADGSEELLEADDIGTAREAGDEYGDVARVICVRHEAEEDEEDEDEDEEENPAEEDGDDEGADK